MRGFFLIVAGGLVSSILGGVLGGIIGWISPEFVELVTDPHPVADPVRLGAGLGVVSGLLLGAAAMAFSLLVGVFRTWVTRGRSGQIEVLESEPHSSRTAASVEAGFVRHDRQP